jgi:MFS family permease
VGLAFLPVTGLIGTLSLGFSARLNLRFGPRATLLPGLVSIGAGLLLMSQISVGGSYFAEVLPAMVLIGAGAGLSIPSLMSLSMSGVRPEEAGLASGMVNTSLQVGGAFGLAVLATLATNRTSSLLGSGDSAATALTSGYRLAFLVGAGLIAIAIAIAAVVLEPVAVPAGAEREELAGKSTELAEPAFSSEAL